MAELGSASVELTELVLPLHTHPFGSEADTCSGGQIMSWMDTAAGIAAKRHSREHVVTVSFDDLHFRALAKVGEVVLVRARVNKAFRTSMEVGIIVYGEHPVSGARRLLCSGYATFIAIDATTQRPKELPQWQPRNDEERQLSLQADERRRVRLARKDDDSGAGIPLADVVEERARGFHQRRTSGGQLSGLFGAPVPLDQSLLTSSSSLLAPPEPLSSPRLSTPLRSPSPLDSSSDGFAYKTVQESRVEMTYIVQPSHANTIGITFGGQILCWMETSAMISAMRHARSQMVLLSVDDLHFKQPTRVGDVVIITSSINRVFHTTMEVGVSVEAEDLLTGQRRRCNNGFMVFIAVDAHERPVALQQVMPTSSEEIRQFREARARRNRRLERRAVYFDLEPAVSESRHSLPCYTPDAAAELLGQLQRVRLDTAWETVSDDDGISVAFSTGAYKLDVTAVCCSVLVPAATAPLLHLLVDLSKRRLWDVLWVDGRVLEVVDDCHDIIYEVSASDPFVSRDFCLLRAWSTTADQHQHQHQHDDSGGDHLPRALAYRSVAHAKAPVRREHVRAEMLTSGWTLLPVSPPLRASQSAMSDQWTQLVWVAQLNFKALSLIVGDIVGRADAVRANLRNIRNLFGQQTKNR